MKHFQETAGLTLVRRALLVVAAGVVVLVISCSSSPDDLLKFEIKAFPEPVEITGIHFVSSSDGYAVTARGDIFKTTDGGNSFSKIFSTNGIRLADIFFATDDVGFAFGSRGILARTTDKGRSWSFVTADTSHHFVRMKGLSKQILLLAGFVTDSAGASSGLIGLSRDGGETWSFERKPYDRFLDLDVYREQHAWILGRDAILYTTNAGQTWESTVNLLRDSVAALFFTDVAHGWQVGLNGRLRHTADGGWSWEEKTRMTENALTCVIGPDAERIYVAGDGIVAVTTNYGRNWYFDDITYPVRFNDSHIVGSTLFLAGSDGMLLKLTF